MTRSFTSAASESAVSTNVEDRSERISVRLRLVGDSLTEAAELWVLKNAPFDNLQHLVNQVDDRTVSRLLFAVAECDGSEIIVIRTRSIRHQCPELLLEGASFRSFLRLPNLYLPCGMRLQPSLRRDVVRRILLADPHQITWLHPHGENGFVPESLPESAFRPLDEWVEYRKEKREVILSPWVGISAFGFELFAVDAEKSPNVVVVKRERAREPAQDLPTVKQSPITIAVERRKWSGNAAAKSETRGGEPLAIAQSVPDELRKRLSELETKFLEFQGPLDAAERQALWRNMADVQTALGRSAESSLCWAYAFWESASIGVEDSGTWQRSESTFRIEEIDASGFAIGSIRSLIAYIVHAACSSATIDPPRLKVLAQIVEKHEGAIPVRLAWLAHFALYRLAQGDVLALTRARDRVLERLFQFGMRIELDLPSFVRFSGKIGRDRVLAVREHLQRLRQLVIAWLRKHPRSRLTPVYADLTFAFGLARLGEVSDSERLLAECAESLKDEDELHTWLLQAYTGRVREIIRGQPAGKALSNELIDRLNGLANDLRYKGDRFRQFSRILEPHEKIDARFRWHQHYPDEIERELASMSGLTDRAELAKRLTALLDGKKMARTYRIAVLAKALELAPRLGEEFACGLLERVIPSLSDTADSAESHALILEKGMYLAAHYDQTPFALSFLERFMQMVANGTAAIQTIEPLIEQLFFGLRKFGLRDMVGQLLERLTTLIVNGRDLQQLRLRLAKQAEAGMLKKELSTWKALLHIASGWLYFGQEEQARPILNEARSFLFQGVLHPLEQTELAGLYIRSLGQAELEPATSRWMELFRKIERIDAVFTTDSHCSLAQLGLIESLVLTLASDEFTLDPKARHWLEDDEYLVRRRIHRDVKAAMQEAGT